MIEIGCLDQHKRHQPPRPAKKRPFFQECYVPSAVSEVRRFSTGKVQICPDKTCPVWARDSSAILQVAFIEKPGQVSWEYDHEYSHWQMQDKRKQEQGPDIDGQ